MAQLLVRDLSSDTIERLKVQAKLHHRSLQGEVKLILEQAAKKQSMEEALAHIEKIRASLGGKTFSDSAELIREDRDR